jgi:hypothetical protein
MNKRIDELAEQCRSYWKSAGDMTYPQFDHRKFAELIVRECMVVTKNYTCNQGLDYSAPVALARHFGVE